MAFPEVYVDGRYAGGWDYGYLGFQIDATPFVRPGENELVVRCDAREHGSRRYPGAGIYRPVRAIFCTRSAWLPEGSVVVTTPEISQEAATVEIAATPKINDETAKNVEIFVLLRAPNGAEIARQNSPLESETGTATFRFAVANPALWDADAPNLYSAEIRVSVDGVDADADAIPLGIRSFEWTGTTVFI